MEERPWPAMALGGLVPAGPGHVAERLSPRTMAMAAFVRR